ncbi:macrophage-capping protein isoform X3 [Chroicocephalus ridibundus]|uniref:macrophage-capping protein isoform X3 n=1 Tax=Chroicocephalus ridibundus TaxID=1192867 RepID=UPI002FDCF87F
MSVCPLGCPSVHPGVHLSFWVSVGASGHPSGRPSVLGDCWGVCPSGHPSLLGDCWGVCPSGCPSLLGVCPSGCPSVHQDTHVHVRMPATSWLSVPCAALLMVSLHPQVPSSIHPPTAPIAASLTPCTPHSPKVVPPSAPPPPARGCTSGGWRSCGRWRSPRRRGVSSSRGTPTWCCTTGRTSEPTSTSGWLNALLGERPVTHREVQGNESDVFMEYFPRGVTYQEGGVDSAFKATRPGAGPTRKLYQVKGKKNIRASERDLRWASFNTGDCFILDLGETLFVWCGARCNVLERNRAQELAAAIRDGERGGKALLEIVVDGEEPPEMLQVSDATGSMKLSQVATSSPFSQSLLCSDDCFVLDNGASGKVYVWKGCKANEQERQAALKVAEEVIARMGHSPRTQVEILPQGRETPLFKQFFASWK